MSHLRSRLTFANVVSLLALFVALSGSATAAILVTGKNVKNNSLTGLDIKNNSLGSADIKDGNLLLKDFKPGQLVAGAPGPAGPQGPKGDAGTKGDKGDKGDQGLRGPSDVYNDSGTSGTRSLSLPAGNYLVIGHGYAYDATPAAVTWFGCQLNGAADDFSYTTLATGGSPASYGSVVVQQAITLPDAGSVGMSCASQSGGGAINDTELSAIKVDALH
jgi:hypothetical protein